MRPIFQYAINKSDPHYAKLSVGLQILLAPLIGSDRDRPLEYLNYQALERRKRDDRESKRAEAEAPL